jgi:hypothetical protein
VREATTDLEGSRVGGCLVTLATFGPITGPAQTYENRRLPRTTQRFAVLSAGRERIEEAAGQSVTLGYSREPPAATFFGRIGNWEQNTQGGEIRVKSGSLQTLGDHTPRQRCQPGPLSSGPQSVRWPRQHVPRSEHPNRRLDLAKPVNPLLCLRSRALHRRYARTGSVLSG